MTEGIRKPFNYRAFWSLLLAVSGVGLPWSGLEIHGAAHQAESAGGHVWMAVHWVFALLFTVGVIGHVVLNGRALIRYVRGFALRVLPLSREALAALAVTAVLLLAAVGHQQAEHGEDRRSPPSRAAHADEE